MFTAYLPIKLNSERVVNKNFLEINKKPLFYYILNTLTQINDITEILVDYDQDEVKVRISHEFPNLKFIKRSKSLSDPKESVNNLISNNIDVIENEYVIQTHVTNPLIKSDTIQKALNQFKTDGIPLFSVNEYYSRFYNKDKTEINHSIETLIPTQELDPIYEENSNFYIFSKENFKDMNNRISKRSNYFVMNKNESIDIDEYEDLEIVKKYLLGL
tara:strand:+ start:204 stop:851 length:648 start_codon:yes stop_codon:yes gene_type:complete